MANKPRIFRDPLEPKGFFCVSFETGRFGLFPRHVRGWGSCAKTAYAHWLERMRNQGLVK